MGPQPEGEVIVKLTHRRAVASDVPFMIRQVVEDSVTPTDDDPAAADPRYAAAFQTIDADPNQELWITEVNGEPIGSFQLTFTPGLMRHGMWRGTIESVHVSPAHRSKGVGGAMMQFAIERCRARGCGLVQLTSNKDRIDAHRFYERLGFSKSHDGFKRAL